MCNFSFGIGLNNEIIKRSKSLCRTVLVSSLQASLLMFVPTVNVTSSDFMLDSSGQCQIWSLFLQNSANLMAKYPINLYKTTAFTKLSVNHKNKAVGVTWTPRCSSHFQCSLPGVIPHAALRTILRETLPKLQWSTLSPSLLLLYALQQ